MQGAMQMRVSHPTNAHTMQGSAVASHSATRFSHMVQVWRLCRVWKFPCIPSFIQMRDVSRLRFGDVSELSTLDVVRAPVFRRRSSSLILCSWIGTPCPDDHSLGTPFIDGIATLTRDRSFVGAEDARPADQVDHLVLAYTNNVTPADRSARSIDALPFTLFPIDRPNPW